MRIEILGTGCYKCIRLGSVINAVIVETGRTDVKVVRIDDERTIRKFMPLDEIPGLVIDGHLVSTGRVPDRVTLLNWLKSRGTVE